MAGGLLQLQFYGTQDILLTNNPQITYFKSVYKRHTNFSTEVIEQTFFNKPNFGNKGSIIINKQGDLISKMYLRVVLSQVDLDKDEKFAWVKRLGYALINRIEIEIGGVNIDRQYGVWLDIWHELARSSDHDSGFNKIVGDVPAMTTYNSITKPEYILFIPLKFWFNRYYGLALPLIAIQYHDIKLKVYFNKLEDLIVYNSRFKDSLESKKLNLKDVSVLTDYIYLGEDERRRFAVMGHEYLIEQVQFTGEDSVIPDRQDQRIKLHFLHPTKELQWCLINGNYTSSKRFLWYTNDDDWTNAIYECSKQILRDSIVIGEVGEDIVGHLSGVWEEVTHNNHIQVTNYSDKKVFINTDSLKIGEYSLTGKISAKLVIMPNCNIVIKDICSGITVRDLSFPVEQMVDTRARSDDVFVNQFSNYGELIDSSINPIKASELRFNDFERFEKREGWFFNYLQPEMNHSNTPKDGINSYSFALNPEWHQPSGSSNLSVVDEIYLNLWFGEKTEKMRDRLRNDQPSLDVINEHSQVFVYAFNYNIFRVMSGLTGVSY